MTTTAPPASRAQPETLYMPVGRVTQLVGTEIEFIRAWISHRYAQLDADDTEYPQTTLAVSDSLFATLAQDGVASRKLQELRDRAQVALKRLPDEPRLSTVAIADGSLYIATPGVRDAVETPWAQVQEQDRESGATLEAAYTELIETAEPVQESVASQHWSTVLGHVAEHIGTDARDDLTAMVRGAGPMGRQYTPNTLHMFITLLGAKSDALQRDLMDFARQAEIGSSGSYTTAAQSLDEAALIEREDEPDGSVGRPPKRMRLVAELPEHPVAYGPYMQEQLT